MTSQTKSNIQETKLKSNNFIQIVQVSTVDSVLESFLWS